MALLTALGMTALFSPSASAALSSVGPVAPVGPAGNESNFPAFYTDSTGLALAPCLDGLPNCLTAAADLTPPGGELFYYEASATVGPFSIANALEGAFFAAGPNNEQTFMRTQIDAPKGGLTPNGKYTINDPYGTLTCTADGGGVIKANACRTETAPAPLNFTSALGGRIGPFLTWDTYGLAAGAPPAGYIGDNVTPHKVTGSPLAYNKVSVQGPGMTGGCTLPDGSTATDCAETDLFVVQGKVAPGVAASAAPSPLAFGNVGGTAPVTKSITYTNTSTGTAAAPAGPVTVSGVTLGGADAAQYAMTENCTTAATGIAPGASCKINVTFTPKPGASSAATVTIADSTPVGTRAIDVTGSSVGKFNVSPTSLAFTAAGSSGTPVGSVSAEDTVVVGNDGPGQLSVTPTLTGFSASHFKFGPTNTCTAPLAAGAGCEIGVQFAPTTTGVKNATLHLTDPSGQTFDVALSGTGSAAPLAAPGTPTIGTATPADASATVTWTGPTAKGNPALTGYKVQAFSGTTLVSTTPVNGATATSGTVTGLTNGTSYTFKVMATNGTQDSTPSAASSAVTPRTVPGQPTGVTGTAGDASATVKWVAPTTTGGSAITGYSVRVFSGTTLVNTVPVGNVLSTNVTGLTNNTAYTFDVAATNAAGTGTPSTASAAVTPVPAPVNTPPGQPTIGTATAGNAAATVTWTAPAAKGTPAMTGYKVQAFAGTSTTAAVTATAAATATSLNVTGLTNGTSYTFKVIATNGTQDSTPSAASSAVTPRTVPGQPTGVTGTAGDASATVKWVAPTSNGGSAITGYSVQVLSGTTVVKTVPVGNVLTTNVTALTNGTAYTFKVAAINAAGTGALSTASTAVTPAAAPVNAPPGAPTIGTATAGVTQATVTWTAPAAKGTPTMTGYKVQAFAGTSTTAFSTTAVTGATSTSGTVTGLTAGTSYTFKVMATNGTQDSTPSAASNAVTPIAALAVTGRAPAVNGTSVPVANNITATFNRAVTGVGTGTFQVKNPAGTVVAGAVTQSTTVANQWVLNPTASLANDTKYTVTLTGGPTAIRDTAGNPLTTLSWSFTTGPAPTVTAKSPASAATGVSRTANVTATFSEAVTGTSGTTVTLKNATTGAAITAVVSYNATTRVVTLNPSATLAASTKFTVTLTGGAAAIRDAANNPLVTTTWSFTTGTT